VNRLFGIAASPAMIAFHDTLSEDDQRALGYLVTLLRLDPWPDNWTKFEYGGEQADKPDLVVYDDGAWSLLYRIEGDRIVLWAGGRRGR
jgi:hypothetical protein